MNISVIYLGTKGAGPIYSFEMVHELVRRGYNVQCIISSYIENYNKWIGMDIDNANVKLIVIDTYRDKKEFILSLFNFPLFYKIVKVVDNFSPSCIYVPMAFMWEFMIIPFISKKILKIKTMHDVIAHSGKYQKFFQYKINLSYRYYDKFVILSELFRKSLLGRGIDDCNIIHIPHANFDYYRDSLLTSSKSPKHVIGFFGTISKYKGIDKLLSAFLKIHEDYPHYKLLIAGKGDIHPYVSQLQALGDNVILYNRWIDDDEVSEIIQLVDFLVLPYTDASQSGVIPLAYSFEKPVIATDVGGLSEQVTTETGILVESNNEIQLIEAMKRMMDDYTLIQQMGHTARQKSIVDNTWDKSVDVLIENIYIRNENLSNISSFS